jgi:hypothetical protein
MNAPTDGDKLRAKANRDAVEAIAIAEHPLTYERLVLLCQLCWMQGYGVASSEAADSILKVIQ